MDWPADAEEIYDQDFKVDDYVDQDEDGNINPLSKGQADKAARSKMIWCKRHLNKLSKNSK